MEIQKLYLFLFLQCFFIIIELIEFRFHVIESQLRIFLNGFLLFKGYYNLNFVFFIHTYILY